MRIIWELPALEIAKSEQSGMCNFAKVENCCQAQRPRAQPRIDPKSPHRRPHVWTAMNHWVMTCVYHGVIKLEKYQLIRTGVGPYKFPRTQVIQDTSLQVGRCFWFSLHLFCSLQVWNVWTWLQAPSCPQFSVWAFQTWSKRHSFVIVKRKRSVCEGRWLNVESDPQVSSPSLAAAPMAAVPRC